MNKKSQIVDFFSFHRQIFGVCPGDDCGEIFRLSDCQLYLKKRPTIDWMDSLDRMDARLADLEEKLQEKIDSIREQAREEGRRLAHKAVRKVDLVFTPRRLNPDDAKVIFHPIDYVVFNGMKSGNRVKNIVLLDRKCTTAEQRRLQKSIQVVVEKGRYRWETLRVGNDGKVTVDK